MVHKAMDNKDLLFHLDEEVVTLWHEFEWLDVLKEN